MYGLKQAGLLANQLLQTRLAPFVYYPARHTQGLWLHKTWPISFTLVVDDFAVKYVGKQHAEHLQNALLQTYEFPDGRSGEYTTNMIAENMYAQCDIEGIQYNLMEIIVDHNTDEHVIAPGDMYIKHGRYKQLSKTTNGWYLCVEWKDGTTRWELLSDLKEFNPVEVAKYAVAKSLLDALAFGWWDPHVLKKRIISIAAVTKSYHKRTHKFGIEAPKIWDDCVRLDKENYNTL
jgi:hypothetical protein